ncbi:hypothetical protein IE3_02234 [Bacillus cereus BAG3X2-1]|nr:hypothetical protein IE3_02234 [Bacillus cereus BAG3X2-1]
MRCNFFYNETQMRLLGGQGAAQSIIPACLSCYTSTTYAT